MSRITLGSNIASLQVERRLAESTAGLSRSFERLSSGLRINRASDDAAGLSISSSLKADTRVYAQGMRNVNDGISLLAIADDALGSLSQILTREQELSEQASNGTLGGKQRLALDAEAQALAKEYARIARTTEFNGQKIFNADFGQLSLQAGYSTLVSGLGGAVGDGTFQALVSYAVGSNPVSVTVADFNGDGVQDLVTADNNANTASVLLGRGDGTFQARVSYAVGLVPESVTVGDFNGDGVQDLASADANSNTVSVLLGRGDGTFQARMSYAVGVNPVSVTVGDFNGDGVQDLATADVTSNTASILLGRGDGTFQARMSYAVGVNPEPVKVGDFNGDGVQDLVTADWAGTANVLLGRGDGTFQARVSYAVGVNPKSVTVGDFNGDGVQDLVTADGGSSTANVLLGRGDGTFQARVSYAVGSWPESVTVGDFNGDGVQDLVTADWTSNTASVLLGSAQTGVSALIPFSLRTRWDAKKALDYFADARERLGIQRGQIGALQSRADVAVATLGVSREEMTAAASRITDVDMAEESASLIRENILQQTGSALLAQANQETQIALQLIQGTRR